MVGKAQKSHGVRSGLYGGCSNGDDSFFIITSAPCDFWDFPTISRGENRLFHYHPEACGNRSTARFREVGGAL
jgi:hypothetical protein